MIYQVNKDGKAPSYAKPGDYIATGGGTYQILDPKNYEGMSSEQLRQAGVGYNPVSGLYSKKVVDPTDPAYANTGVGGTNYENLVERHTGVENWNPMTYDTVDQWKENYINQQLAGLQTNFDNNMAILDKNHNENVRNKSKEMRQVDADYEKNIDDLYDNVYMQRKLAVQNAGRNGITSTAQAQAASNALLYKATDTAADLTSDRDVLKANIRSDIDRLIENHGIDKQTLKKNFDSAKLNAMSTAELQYLEKVLNIDQHNVDLWNSMTMAKAERDWQSAEAQKERDFKIMLEQMFGSGSGGNYSGSSKEDLDVSDLAYALEYETQNVPKDEIERFAAMLIGVEQGRYKKSDVAALINNTIKKYNYSANNPDWAHKNNVSSLTDSYDKYMTSQIR